MGYLFNCKRTEIEQKRTLSCEILFLGLVIKLQEKRTTIDDNEKWELYVKIDANIDFSYSFNHFITHIG